VQIDIKTRGIRMVWVDGALAGWAVGGVWTDAPNQRRQSKDGSSQRGG